MSKRRKKERADGRDWRPQTSAQDPRTGALAQHIAGALSIPVSSISGGPFTHSYVASANPRLTWGAVTPAAAEAPEPEVVESDLPILATRVASLRFDGSPRHWGALNQGTSFGVDADASCNVSDRWYAVATWGSTAAVPRPRRHEAPDLKCQCGFYAVPADVDPWADTHDYVTLLVELSGTVIEHEKGYRAQHQRVIECQLPACQFCGREAEVLDVREARMFTATCEAHVATVPPEHAGTGRVLLSVADVEALLPVPVTRLARCGGGVDLNKGER